MFPAYHTTLTCTMLQRAKTRTDFILKDEPTGSGEPTEATSDGSLSYSGSPYQFFPVTFANIGISTQNFLTFSLSISQH